MNGKNWDWGGIDYKYNMMLMKKGYEIEIGKKEVKEMIRKNK